MIILILVDVFDIMSNLCPIDVSYHFAPNANNLIQ